jgi:hypothetical protein
MSSFSKSHCVLQSFCVQTGRATEQAAQGHPIFPHDGGEHPAEDTEKKCLHCQILVLRMQ